ncbi:conserved hypothetical protein [Ricinus communis]|uniref:Uncharacterized protein n=1 Tax=Ricinus communis TaxID=3988 RepID=B9TFJ1_RICCO|nr:conserved hypothetical protein [Ricinus communis]
MAAFDRARGAGPPARGPGPHRAADQSPDACAGRVRRARREEGARPAGHHGQPPARPDHRAPPGALHRAAAAARVQPDRGLPAPASAAHGRRDRRLALNCARRPPAKVPSFDGEDCTDVSPSGLRRRSSLSRRHLNAAHSRAQRKPPEILGLQRVSLPLG